jgi:hypothetical protein
MILKCEAGIAQESNLHQTEFITEKEQTPFTNTGMNRQDGINMAKKHI